VHARKASVVVGSFEKDVEKQLRIGAFAVVAGLLAPVVFGYVLLHRAARAKLQRYTGGAKHWLSKEASKWR
jgi:hypothetical protein